MIKIIIIIFFLLFNISGFSQDSMRKIDSLLKRLNVTKTDSAKIEIYVQISWYYKNNNFEKALEYGKLALSLSKSKQNNIGIVNAKNNIGNAYYYKGDYFSALIYWLDGYKLSEKIHYIKGMAKLSGNIGLIYEINKDYKTALEYQMISLEINKKLKNLKGEAGVLNNIGILYHYLGELDKELDYYLKSLEIKKKINNLPEIASSLNNIGTVYYKNRVFEKALNFHNEALEIYNRIQEKEGIAESCINIGQVYLEIKNYKEAVFYLKKSLSISEEIDFKLLTEANSQALSEVYNELNDYKTALYYFKKYSDIKDSIFNETSHKQISELQTKYETEKKDLKINLLNKDKTIQEKELQKKVQEIKNQRILIFSFVLGFTIILIFSLILYKLFNQKKKANILLIKQKEEIIEQRNEIESQRDKLNEQKQEITDSITYAKRIQQAVLPTGEFANRVLGNHFILFKPKDIVSGDFYWSTRIGEILVFTVADCTGHGVPGAFMSMLGISFLNEIVRKKEITKASEVLNQLRESIIEALQQKGESGEQKDGMDIALCAINMNTLEMQFAGANNPCWVVSSRQEAASSQELPTAAAYCQLLELKPDKQPIGIHSNMHPFTNQTYQFQKGDTIYLMSDGYEDQFGGPNRKKFLAKNLKNLLIANSQQPIANQKQILETTLTEWIGTGEQIDDITILGIKI